MRLDEFRRIKLKVTKDNEIIYDGEAEMIPEEFKALNTIEVKIQPGLAEVVVEDAKIVNDEEDNLI